jgi:hypothetical protein
MKNTLSVDLNSITAWTNVMDILELDYPDDVLPCRICCPLCQGNAFTIYNDNENSSGRYSCTDCGSHGDMLQLASLVLGLDLTATIALLGKTIPSLKPRKITPEVVEAYLTLVVALRQRTDTFWGAAVKKLFEDDSLRQLRLNIGLTTLTSKEDWLKRGGQFVGAATRKEIDKILIQHSRSRSIFSRHQLNTDIKSSDVFLLIPFYDIPFHITSFGIYRLVDNLPVPFKYVSLTNKKDINAKKMLPGVAALDALYYNIKRNDDTAYIFAEALEAIQLHNKHLEITNVPLPIVGIWPKADVAQITKIHANTREFILVANKASADLFRHAKAMPAKIALARPTDSNKLSVSTILKAIKDEARPWEHVFEEYLGEIAPIEASTLLLQMGMSDQEILAFVSKCPVALRERLEYVTSKLFQQRQIKIGAISVVENEHGWQIAKTGETISNAVIRIETITNHVKKRKMTYSGYIIHNGEHIHFCEDKSKLDKAAFKWLDDFLIEKGKQALVFNSVWQYKIMTVARQFHKPKVEQNHGG